MHTRDLGGEYVLLSSQFYYFGEAAQEIPLHLTSLIIPDGASRRGHRVCYDQDLIHQFEEWI